MVSKEANEKAKALLDTCTKPQLDEIGVMLGMSNCGMNRMDRPDQMAEDDESYNCFMEEIKGWQKLLRNKKEEWGWCDDLDVLVQEAKKRRPVKS